jgi:hypothetical protein
MMFALKGKLINWSQNNLSLAGKILVANQVLLASMWYLATCWNPNPRMCCHVRGVVKNFIWGSKDAPAHAKIKWDTLALPTTQGGLGIIDPKTQSEALLAKLLVKSLVPGGEPWKELVKHKADQIRLPVHDKGPNTPNINWLFAAPKLNRIQCSMWKNIIGVWLNVRPGLTKADPTNAVETLRNPLFGNLSILNTSGTPLEIGGLREGCAFMHSGCSQVKDLWNSENNEWKSLSELRMSYHASNKKCKDIITASIPWRPDEYTNHIQAGDWISNPTPNSGTPLDWVYFVLESARGKTNMIEFKKIAPNGRI